MEIFSTIRCVLLFIAVVFMCVGTGVEQIKNKVGGVTTKIYLYGVKSGSASVKSFKDAGFCKDFYQRWQAAYAFAIISCIIVGVAFVAVILMRTLKDQMKVFWLLSAAASAVAFVTTLICWAIVVALYHGEFCGATESPQQQGYDLVAIVLIVLTWILVLFDVVVAVLSFLKAISESDD